MAKIQIITIVANVLFILYISRLIIKGKLREEYAIVWVICTLFLLVFSLLDGTASEHIARTNRGCGGGQPGVYRVHFRHIGLPAAFERGGIETV